MGQDNLEVPSGPRSSRVIICALPSRLLFEEGIFCPLWNNGFIHKREPSLAVKGTEVMTDGWAPVHKTHGTHTCHTNYSTMLLTYFTYKYILGSLFML